MLFAICVVAWCYGYATTPQELIFPWLATVIRAGYLRRHIAFITKGALFVAVLAVTAPLAVPIYQALTGIRGALRVELVSAAVLFAGRILVTVMVMVNLSDDPTVRQCLHWLMRLSASMGVLAQLVFRYPSEVRLRAGDVLYAGKLRLRAQKLSIPERLRVLWAIAVALAIELSSMANQVAVVLAARGKMPRASLWKTAPQGARAVLMADVIYIASFVVIWGRVMSQLK
jgi:hypothetical protein